MAHYVCTGECGGAADRPGMCQAEDCSKEGQPLTPCSCEDGMHDDVEKNDEEDAEGE